MAGLFLQVKYIKKHRSPIFYCPKPQDNNDCQGKFLRTRVGQKECVACMKLHKTLLKHPLFKKISLPYQFLYLQARDLNNI